MARNRSTGASIRWMPLRAGNHAPGGWGLEGLERSVLYDLAKLPRRARRTLAMAARPCADLRRPSPHPWPYCFTIRFGVNVSLYARVQLLRETACSHDSRQRCFDNFLSGRLDQASSGNQSGGIPAFLLISPTEIEVLGVTAGVIGFSPNLGALRIRREPDITDPTPHLKLNLCVVDLRGFHLFFPASFAAATSDRATTRTSRGWSSPSEVRRARMRARSCNFALRNRLKRDRSPDFRDMLTSFLVRRAPRVFLAPSGGRRTSNIVRLPENYRCAIVHNAWWTERTLPISSLEMPQNCAHQLYCLICHLDFLSWIKVRLHGAADLPTRETRSAAGEADTQSALA